jgi:hypothetical protein
MLFGTSNFDRQGIINNTVAFEKAARVFDVPMVLTTVETKSFSCDIGFRQHDRLLEVRHRRMIRAFDSRYGCRSPHF